jgi:hypothetical protein
MDRLAAPAIMVVLLGGLACNESTSVGGAWSGSNARYASVVLDLTEVGDSLAGSIDVTPTGSSRFTTAVIGRQTNDSVYVWGDPLPPSAGGGFGTTFVGRLTVLTIGAQLTGCLSAREQPCSQIVLGR